MRTDGTPLFRPQAAEFHRRGGIRGDVLRISSSTLSSVFWLVVGLGLVCVAFVCVGEVHRYGGGPAVVLLEGRHEVTASRSGVVSSVDVAVGQRVREDQVLVQLAAPIERSELAAAEREWDEQLAVLVRAPEDRAARAALLELRSRRDVARASVQRSALVAPVTGEVVDLRVRVGQPLEAGAPVLAVQAEPRAARLTALLPGADRPRLRTGMPILLRMDGFESARLELVIDQVDGQVLGPAEAVRAIGVELAGAFDVRGSVVLVQARLPTDGFRAKGIAHRLYHGMTGRAEVAVETEPLIYAWLPGLREALGDVF